MGKTIRERIEDALAKAAGIPKEKHINLLGNKNKYIDAIVTELTTPTIEQLDAIYNEGAYG